MNNAARSFYKSADRAQQGRPVFVLRPIAYCVMLACCEIAAANPTGPQVISGNVQIQGLGSDSLKIINSPGSIINWQGFSIGAGQLTQFLQQSGASTVLNRVVGADISKIQGQLQSNGRVFLINPAGIVIGAGAVIDTAGFVGSTLNMLDSDFLAGKLRFQGDASSGAIVNQGFIKTTNGGSVVLVAPNIENSGIIQTDDGKILLAAGKKLTIGSLDANDVQFEIQAPTDSVLNIGQLLANGGAVGVFAGTLKHTGDIRANALTRDEGGRIVLKAQGDVTLAAGSHTSADGKTGGDITVQSTGGTTIVSGEVSAKGSDGRGGDVRVLGDRVGVFDSALIDASGTLGGGQILVGGDYTGGNADVQNAKRTAVSADAMLRADATESGDGGKVIVWSDEVTRFDGTISARGGASGGNGGFAETSSMGALAVGDARVDLAAPAGQAGTWLLDPINIVVQNGLSLTTLAQVDQFSDPGATVTVTPATIGAAAANVTLQADNDITFVNSVSVPTTRSFTVQAGRSILINPNVAITGADSGPFSFTANETVAAGVHAANRSAGAATIDMGVGSSIAVSGGTSIVLRMNTGAGQVGTSGNIVLSNLSTSTAGSVSVIHNGPTAGGSILRADANSLVTAVTSEFFGLDAPAGSAASIGTSAAPIRVDTPILDARNINGTGGIFIDSQRNTLVTIGGSGLTGAGLSGIQAPAGGPIVFTTLGDLSLSLTGAGAPAPCGSTSGGPVCAGPAAGTLGAADTVTLRALDMVIGSRVRGNEVTLLPSLVTANNQISLVADPGRAAHLHLNQAEINQIDTGTLHIGDNVSGDVSFIDPSGTFNAPLVMPAGTKLDIHTGGNIVSGTATSDITTTNTNITLTAAGDIGAVGNRLLVGDPGTATVTSNNAANVFLEQTAGDMQVSQYFFFNLPGSPAVTLATTNGNINANNTSFCCALNISLITGGPSHTITLPGSGNITANSLILTPTGGTTLTGTQIFNTPVTTSGSIISSGAVTFNGALTLNAGAGLTVNAGTTTIGAPSDISGTLVISNTGTLAVNATTSVNGNFSLLNTGTQTGTGTLSLVGANNVWQDSGAMTGTGTTTIVKGNLTISGAADKTFRQHTLSIAAGSSLDWTGGNMLAGDGGTIQVPASVTFDISNNNSWLNTFGGTPTTLALGGLLSRGTTAGTVALDAMMVTGAGQIDVNAGTLRLSRDAGVTAGALSGLTRIGPANTLEFAGGVYTKSGNFSSTTAGRAGSLTVSGGSLTTTGTVGQINALTLSGGSATFGATAGVDASSIAVSGATTTGIFNGAVIDGGTLSVTGGGVDFNAATTVAGATTFSGGAIGGTGGLTLNGAATWSAGTMVDGGTTTTTAGLTLSGAGTKSLDGGRILTNAGTSTATWSGAGGITLGGGATINNVGLWDDQSTNASITNSGGAGATTFTNTGTFQKTAAGTTTIGANVVFNNSGTSAVVDVNAGTLRLAGGGTSVRPFAVTGTLDFANDYALNAGSNMTGAGTIQFSGGTETLTGANYNMAGGSTSVTGGTANFNAGTTVPNIGAVTINGGALNLNSATATINAPSTLTITNGALGGANTITVAGVTSWSGGTMTGTGTTTANGGLVLSGTANKDLDAGRTLTNGAGSTATWTNAAASGLGAIRTGAGTTVNNAGTWQDQTTDGLINHALGGVNATFSNTGTYTKAVAGTTLVDTGVAFNNTGPAGLVQVQNGTLKLNGGGTDTGTFDAGNGTAVEFAGGTHTLGAGSVLTGAGTGKALLSGGTLNVNAATAARNFDLTGGTLGGSAVLTTTNSGTWSGGTIDGATGGGWTIGPVATLAIVTGASPNLLDHNGRLVNQGTLNWSGSSSINLANSSTIRNQGAFNSQSDQTIQATSGTGSFVNTGTFTKSGGTLTTFPNIPVTNNGGTFDAQVGAITFSGNGNTFAGGSFVSTGAGTGTNRIQGDSVLSGTIHATKLELAGGVFTDPSGVIFDAGSLVNWRGGTFDQAGTTTFAAGSGLDITSGSSPKLVSNAHVLLLAGTTDWSGASDINLANDAQITNQGAFNVQNDQTLLVTAGTASFNNAGTFSKTGLTGTTNVSTAFNNTNTVTVTSGTLKLNGGGSGSGSFNTANGTAVEFGGGTHTLGTGSALNSTGTGKYVLSNGALTANTAIAVRNFDETGGALGGSGIVTLSNAGNWTGGSIDGATGGQFVVAGTGTLAVDSGAAAKLLDHNGQLVNQGTLNWSGSSSINLANSSTIRNQGAFNSQSDQTIQATSGTGSFVNTGTFTKSGGTLTTFPNIPVTNNGGTFDAQVGAITFSGNGNTFAGGSFVSTGAVRGTNRIQGDSVLSGTIHATKLELAGGVFTDPSGVIFDAGSLVNWTGGTFDQAGTTTFAAGSRLDITPGSSPKLVSNAHVLTLAGTANWSDPTTLNVANGAQITNQGVFNSQNDQTVQVTSGTGSFVNTGTFTKSGGTLTTFSSIPVTSTGGTFDAQVGAIVFSGTGNTFAGGSFVSTGAGTGTNRIQGDSVLSGTIHATKLELVTGAFTDPSGVTFDAGTVVSWTGGTFDQAGTTTFAAGSQLDITSGSSAKLVNNTHVLSLGGTTNWSGASNISLANSASISNTGTFNVNNDQSFVQTSGTASFVNAGTFRKSASAGNTTFAGVAVTNSGGTFDAQTGTIVFNAPGNTFTGGSFLTTGAGTGTNRIQGNSVLSGTIHSTSLELASGTLTGAPTFDAGSAVSWTGSTLDQAGTTTFAAGSTLNITGAAGKLLDHGHAVSLGGTTNWGGAGNLILNNGAQITNAPGGTFNAQTDQTLAATTGAGTFTNAGTFNKAGTNGTTTIATAFTNPGTGTINVNSGTLQVNSAFPTNDGTINVQAGASFSTNAAALTNAGTVGGEGTLDLGGKTLTNTGTLRPGAATGDTTGTLSITGALVQDPAGQINLEFGGPAAGNFDAVAVSGAVTIAGTVNVTNVAGYTPTIGDAFQVITAASRSGNFSTVNKSFGTAMTAAYSNTGLQFTIGGGPVDTWVSTNGDWSVGGNWNLGHAPGPGETAVIPDGPGSQTVTIPAGTFTPDALTSNENIVLAGGTLSLANASTINGNFALNNGALPGAGAFTVNGALNTTGGTISGAGGVTVNGATNMSAGTLQLPGNLSTSALNVTGGVLNTGGLLAVTGPGASTVTGATLANAGTLRVSGGGNLTVATSSTFTNTGTIDVQAGTTTIGAAFPTNPGTIKVGPGATFSTSGHSLSNTGIIGGNGTIDLGGTAFTLTNDNGGTVSPGASPGTLAILGNFTQGPLGVLAIELGGIAPGTFDVLNVSGVATLGGALNVTNFGAFVPTLGNRFDFMTFASRSGNFATITFPPSSSLQALPGATTYALTTFGAPPDSTADELRRLDDNLHRLVASQNIEEEQLPGTRQVCN